MIVIVTIVVLVIMIIIVATRLDRLDRDGVKLGIQIGEKYEVNSCQRLLDQLLTVM